MIAGQGIAALELAESVAGLDEVWVPVGGGGLAGGTLQALSGRNVRVRGVEPELADDAFWSMKKGHIQHERQPLTIADGLRTALGELPFSLFQRFGLTIVTVTEEKIRAAQQLVWQRLKLVVEPSAAVPLAGLLDAVEAEPARYLKRRVAVILSGGNAQFPGRS